MLPHVVVRDKKKDQGGDRPRTGRRSISRYTTDGEERSGGVEEGNGRDGALESDHGARQAENQTRKRQLGRRPQEGPRDYV